MIPSPSVFLPAPALFDNVSFLSVAAAHQPFLPSELPPHPLIIPTRPLQDTAGRTRFLRRWYEVCLFNPEIGNIFIFKGHRPCRFSSPEAPASSALTWRKPCWRPITV